MKKAVTRPEHVRMEFLLRAPKSAHPKKLSDRWELYEYATYLGESKKAVAIALGVAPTTVGNAVRDVNNVLQSELIDPSDEAIERKRKIYFAHLRNNSADSEQGVPQTMLRNWDIFMRREIQRPRSHLNEIQAAYGKQIDGSELIRIVKTIKKIIGDFDEDLDMVREDDALDQYLGLT